MAEGAGVGRGFIICDGDRFICGLVGGGFLGSAGEEVAVETEVVGGGFFGGVGGGRFGGFWRSFFGGGFGAGFLRRGWGIGGGVGEGPLELDAEEAAVGGEGWAVDFVDFGEEGGEGGEAVGEGVGGGEGLEGGEFVDGGDEHFAKAGGEGDRVGFEAGGGPEADGLVFFAGADEVDEMFFEEEHGGVFAWMGSGVNGGGVRGRRKMEPPMDADGRG